MKKVFLVLFFGTFFLLFTHNSFAQKYPTKPVRIIVPYAAGGSNDSVARFLQQPIGKALGGTIIVENIPAGTTKLATLELMKADPDGHTLLHLGVAPLMSYYYSGTYDSKVWEKMTVIVQTAEMPYAVIEVRADSPFKTWSDLVSFAKKNPGKLTCGGPGAGGVMNLIVSETAQAAGIDVKYVPFAGAGPSGTALLGGHIDYRVCQPIDATPRIKAGQTRALGVAYVKRLFEMPDVPTFKELGLPEYPYMDLVLWGPANLSPNIVSQISKAVETALKDPGYVDFCKRLVLQPVFKDAQMLKEDMKSFEKGMGPRLEAAYPKK